MIENNRKKLFFILIALTLRSFLRLTLAKHAKLCRSYALCPYSEVFFYNIQYRISPLHKIYYIDTSNDMIVLRTGDIQNSVYVRAFDKRVDKRNLSCH